jgi:hypothetical protein
MVLFCHWTTLGDVVLHQQVDASSGRVTCLKVLQADPRVLISGELLRQLEHGDGWPTLPYASVDHVSVGGIVRINASNQRLIYVLTEYEPVVDGLIVPDTYVGEWQD